MSISNITEARREMFGVLQDAMSTANLSALGTVVIHYEGRDMGQKDPSSNYVEIYNRPALDLQASLPGGTGERRWENTGTLWIMCFGSLASGRGLENAETLSTIAKVAYRGKATENCIWFRNIRPQIIGSSGGWYQINILVDYEYDEVR